MLDKHDALYAKMRDEVFDEGELAAIEEQGDDYQNGWWDGVVALYANEIIPKSFC